MMMMIRGYVNRLKNAFGIKFVALIILVQCLIKGITFIIMTEGVLPFFKYLGIDAIQTQVLGAIAMSPWTIKPLTGLMSDLIAVMGVHKKYTMLYSCVIGVFGCTMLILDVLRQPLFLVLFIGCVHFQIATLDVLIEGKYAEFMRKHPETGSDIVTLASGTQRIGFIVALSFVGPLADMKYFRICNIIALCMCVTPVLPIIFNWLPEVPIQNAPYLQLDTRRIKQDWRIITVVIITGISAPAVAAVSALAMKWLGLVCAAGVVVIVIIGCFLSFSHPIIARVALYQILIQSSRISFSSVLGYFFTADPVCLPGGPNFKFDFYITITGIVGAATSLATMFLYQLVLSKWRFRSVLMFTSFLSAFAGLFDYMIVKRWNLVMGIPDSVFFLIGDDVFASVVDSLYYIPSSAIIGKVCPENMEASTYAYLAGIANFGLMISVIGGAMLAEVFGVKTATPNCNWDNLPTLILIGHTLVPIAVSIGASFLIPNVPQDCDMFALYGITKKDDAEEEEERQSNKLMEIPMDGDNDDF